MRLYIWVFLMSACLVDFASADNRLSAMPDSPESEQEMLEETAMFENVQNLVGQTKPIMALEAAKKMVETSDDFRGIRYLVEQSLEHGIPVDPRYAGDHPENNHWSSVLTDAILFLGRSSLPADQEFFVELVRNSTTLFLGLDCYECQFIYSNLDQIAFMKPSCKEVATGRALNDWQIVQKEAGAELAQLLYEPCGGPLQTGRTPAEEISLFFGSKIKLPPLSSSQ